MDEKSKAKLLGLTSTQGKVLASFHNALPDILGSIGDKPSVPISTLKTMDKWWSKDGTAENNDILRDNLKKTKKAV